jgi:DNA-binding IclR family transcriptional regulator
MFERLTAWWKERRRPRTDRELAEEEALRREAEEAQGQGHGLGGGW